MDRIIFTISSVLRSHLDDMGESQRECHNAVLNRNGTLGTTNLAIAAGEVSMVEFKTKKGRQNARSGYLFNRELRKYVHGEAGMRSSRIEVRIALRHRWSGPRLPMWYALRAHTLESWPLSVPLPL